MDSSRRGLRMLLPAIAPQWRSLIGTAARGDQMDLGGHERTRRRGDGQRVEGLGDDLRGEPGDGDEEAAWELMRLLVGVEHGSEGMTVGTEWIVAVFVLRGRTASLRLRQVGRRYAVGDLTRSCRRRTNGDGELEGVLEGTRSWRGCQPTRGVGVRGLTPTYVATWLRGTAGGASPCAAARVSVRRRWRGRGRWRLPRS